jgi:Rad3-related DNA helicase
VLEGVGMVVIDEAHHAPDIVTQAFAAKVTRSEAIKAAAALDKRGNNTAIEATTKRFFDAVDVADEEIAKTSDFREEIASLCSSFAKEVSSEAEQSKSDSANKNEKFQAALADFREDIVDSVKEVGDLATRKTTRGEKQVYSAMLEVDFVEDGSDFSISAVPVDVSFFKGRLLSAISAVGVYSTPPRGPEKTIVLCSGTMNASVPRLLGLGGASVMHTVQSPFDPARARLYVAKHLPIPKDPKWESEAWEDAKAAILAAEGRTLFLCTSNRMVAAFAERAKELPYTVLRQGEASRTELVRQFTEDEHSVLIATLGYWEGIDVPGPALSLVIMDKIPFPVPTDSIAKARSAWVEAEGGNAFAVVAVGRASTLLAQGSGRLIRSDRDCGGVMILDSRLSKQKYGSSALSQIEPRWLRYDRLDGFLGWMGAVADAHRAGDPDAVLDYAMDAQPLRTRMKVAA